MTNTSNSKINIIIGNNIKRLIQSKGIYQNVFADSLGVSESTVGKWILGKSAPRMGIIQKISDIYGIDKSDLLSSSESSKFDKPNNIPATELMDKIIGMSPEELQKISALIDIIRGGDK
jgi:transcriptional regulator with XRE-family HTH domain